MAETIGAFAPRRRQSEPEVECIREVHAQFVSLGGAIILSVCITLTLLVLMAFQLPQTTAVQRGILVLLGLASWIYLIDSVTEKLRLVDHSIEYRSFFSRPKLYALSELEAVLYVHQGFNLERGFESVEFRRVSLKPDRISLGPCWQRNKLEGFMRSIEVCLNDPHLFEEVR
jgi:hypothetical protein